LFGTKHIGVGGDSAGGNLTGGVTRLQHDRRGPPLLFHMMVGAAIDPRFQRMPLLCSSTNATNDIISTLICLWD
jgi:acetyl esterase/lipase